jgi:hypothetical protein
MGVEKSSFWMVFDLLDEVVERRHLLRGFWIVTKISSRSLFFFRQ